ncbi:MAG TPA: hypothetical protein QGF58_19630 [Myxococcota bacterium]|nr:hypothetical protein [Myxococcota bacterium]
MSSSGTGNRRRWLFRGLGIFAAPLVALLLVEGGARVLAAPAQAELTFNAPDNAPDGLYVNSHELGHRPTPGFEGVSISPGYRVDVRVNSLGLRGPEPGPDEGLERWLVTGDSFTFAVQVDEEQTFTALLAEGRETFNGGADGYGTWQVLRQYRMLDDELGLDGLLVVFFTGNDLHDNERRSMVLHDAERRPDGSPMPSFRTPWWRRLLSQHSYLHARWKVVQRTRALESGQGPDRQRWARELAIFTESGQRDLDNLLKTTRPLLAELSRETSERGDELLVAVSPPGFAVDPTRTAAAFSLVGHDPETATPRAPTDAVLAELDALSVPSCDLHAPLDTAISAGTRAYFDFDGHWTPEGHRIVADALEACLQGP